MNHNSDSAGAQNMHSLNANAKQLGNAIAASSGVPRESGAEAAVVGESLAKSRQSEFLGDEGFEDAEFFSTHLRCDQPAKLRGRILMEMEPHRFCDAPLILKVAIQDVQPYSVLVSWQTREHSGLHGYHVVYRSMEEHDSKEVSFHHNCLRFTGAVFHQAHAPIVIISIV